MKKANKLSLEWFLKAREDEKSAEILLKEGGPANSICFHCHQIVEKCFKGYLVFQNKEFPKIHQLDLLLELCAKIDKDFLKIKEDVFYLRPFYFETRYPGAFPQYTKKEAKKAFRKAQKIKKFVLKKTK